VSGLLNVAAAPWRAVNRIRRALYRAGILKAKRLPKPVISVGNIAAGGAGKTPAVIAIAEHLIARGKRVAVLTRGYGARETGLVTDLNADRFGDEPVLIKKRVPKADVIVGRNRYANASLANCAVYLLDDGFQHLKIERDLDIVIDVSDAPVFREGRSALRDADVVIPRDVCIDAEMLRGKRVFAFAGIANNEQFFESLRGAGVEVIGTRGFRDHHRYTAGDLHGIDATMVTTEKDAVKLKRDDIIAVRLDFIIPDHVFARIDALV
jgi:tetraacyldisaccharide 4'-kinase